MTFKESDGRIVPLKSGDQSDGMKPSNIGAGKAARPLRDPDRAPSVLRDGPTVLTRLDHIHQRAESQPDAVFNNLFSLLNYELLWFAFRRLKRGKAPGVDGVTLEDYEARINSTVT
jgi:RNA-directed DNA polymerase